MKSYKHVLDKTRKKFFLTGIISFFIIFLLSGFYLFLSKRLIFEQQSFQIYNSELKSLSLLINQIKSNSEQINPNYIPASKENELDENILELKKMFTSFKENKNHSDELYTFLQENKLLTKLNKFVSRASDLSHLKDISKSEIKRKIRKLSMASNNDLEDVLLLLGRKVEAKQYQSLKRLELLGVLLVVTCIIQFILIWFFVFKPLYQALIDQNERITESLVKVEIASKSKTNFLANISHEIRTPMTAILGYIELIKDEDSSLEAKDEAVRIVSDNANHLLTLIDEILDISTIESGKISIEKHKISLSKFLSEIYSFINVKAATKNIELIFTNSGDIPEYIINDPKRLKQILFNLIGNAIKFTSEGHVELVAKYDERLRQIIFDVNDTGVGMSKKQQALLFMPFEQGDSSVNRKFGGTGLGLFLSRKLARELGGDINIISSKIGFGSTFRINLNIGELSEIPLKEVLSPVIETEEVESINPEELLGTKILVIDDAKENARLFSLYLSKAGAHVQIAISGKEGIKLFTKNKFDIVLLDLQMPELDGYQVIKRLMSLDSNIVVLALTAHAMEEEKLKTKNAGFQDHITKPVKPYDLVMAVKKNL